eukprot:14700670-Alexandrium_andersonii.AAC.1
MTHPDERIVCLQVAQEQRIPLSRAALARPLLMLAVKVFERVQAAREALPLPKRGTRAKSDVRN